MGTTSTLAADLFRTTAALVVVVDAAGRVVEVNPAVLQATGLNDGDLVGHDVSTVLCIPREALALRRVLRVVARTGEPRQHEHRLPSPPTDPERRTSIAWTSAVLQPEAGLVACVGIDVSAARSAAEDLLARALTDELTGLPNRAHVQQVMGRMAGTGGTVMFCDLNGFKEVNDKFGHAAGDQVLVEVGRRLKLAVRGEDLVGRYGGDEFVIVAPPHPTASADGLARRVRGAMRQPMILGGGVVAVVGLSVGTAVLGPGQDPGDVLREADAQMYSSKTSRASTFGRIDPAQ